MLKCCNVQIFSLLSIDSKPDHDDDHDPDTDPDTDPATESDIEPEPEPDPDPEPHPEPDTDPDEEMHRAISGEYAEPMSNELCRTYCSVGILCET